ncbi:MAG TPA: DUF692 domain-containing protein [Plasticicumulans sp.]|uniref:MNIO family bufferin maturase n=1 Tax=Plasticicumulans sp. TaxID=2307179 RepID=UPI002CE947A2|nr:DUF692 domain-containing protein [Plasticicumulans sp.]HMW31278.1 DUF692 domain-containing protein [Plasticicumulans sp.]HMW43289.1 DUF692 domain-containing protein [Plasticicumulans sp.]
MPAIAGIGLRGDHYEALLAGDFGDQAGPGWVEVHSENYFGDGGRPLAVLDRVRAHWPVSLHGVGLGLGNADGLDRGHLARLQALVARVEPGWVSEHLCWTAAGGQHLNDLLPLPMSEEALALVCRHVQQVQEALGRPLLVENVSRYLDFAASVIPEGEFLAELVARTGCGLLLDVNNLYVNHINHGDDPLAIVAALPAAAIGEIHLAGHSRREVRGQALLIDTHDAPVCAEVWALYRQVLARIGPRATLIERDSALPPLPQLLAEAAIADACLGACRDEPA